MADRESPWKELIESDAAMTLQFFYPDIHADLDWTRDVESLEQEFRKSHPKAARGKRIVDKLLRAFRKDTGDPRYLHLEVQAQRQRRFRRRVYEYNSRAEDFFDQPIVSLPILIDDDPNWFPRGYRSRLYGTSRILTFRSVKVLRWRGREEELAADANPVGLFVMAHLEGRRTKDDEPARAEVKVRILQNLLQRSRPLEDLRHWYRYFDWLLPLSDEYDKQVWEQISMSKKEGAVPFTTFAEKYGREKGFEEGEKKERRAGLLDAITLGLELKFGQEGLALIPDVEKMEDLARLQTLRDAIKPAASLDDIRKLLPPNGEQPAQP